MRVPLPTLTFKTLSALLLGSATTLWPNSTRALPTQRQGEGLHVCVWADSQHACHGEAQRDEWVHPNQAEVDVNRRCFESAGAVAGAVRQRQIVVCLVRTTYLIHQFRYLQTYSSQIWCMVRLHVTKNRVTSVRYAKILWKLNTQ